MAERASWSLGAALRGVFGAKTIDEDTWDDLESALIRADFGPAVTEEIVDAIKAQVERYKTTDPQDVQRMLREIVEERLSKYDPTLKLTERPAVVLVVGVNGVGKTTTIGKFARFLRTYDRSRRGRRRRHVPCRGGRPARDVGRARRASASSAPSARARTRHPSPSRPSSRPSATAPRSSSSTPPGRLHTKGGLMDELGKIKRVVEKQAPISEVLLVLDATTGQNGLAQAEAFIEHGGVTGLVLTKLDGSAKGGFVLAVQEKTGLPIKLIGQGEGIGDLTGFTPHVFAQKLVG